MLTPDAALERLDLILSLARSAGATAADAVYAAEASAGIGVRMGSLEDVGRTESAEVGLRVFDGARSAQVSISDLSPAAFRQAVEQALAMARVAPDDPYAGLAPSDMLARGPFDDLDLFDPAVEALQPDQLRAIAEAAEDAARAVPGIVNSEGGSASAGTSVMALATSHGFRGSVRGSSVSTSAVVVAGSGASMQRDYEWHQARHLADLEDAHAIGRRAGERTMARMNPVKPATGAMPVVFDPRVSSGLLGHLLGAITASSFARGTSFLKGRLEDQLFDPGIRIMDDPHRPRGSRSRRFDGEGLPTAPRAIVDGGRVTGLLAEVASARQLGMAPTGHASRGTSGPPGVSATNLWLAAGTLSPAALMADIQLGLYVTELIGMGVNGLTGDYSRGAGGFLIRRGQLAEPVAEVTIAGNLLLMFAAMVPADDLVFRTAVNAPTVRIDGMTIAGQ